MTEKRRTVILCVLVCLLIVTLMTFSLTRARYSGEHESESEYGSDIEYTVSNQVEVSTADEFFTAIENGYSNVVISDDADSSIIITGGVSDVNSDLTIDLNGHELQRNNRDPMLNVTEGVRLTIVDSKGGGGFYNPVGSVLRISGGTLTVAAGLFESGPRDGASMSAENGSAVHPSEYADDSGESWSASEAGGFTETTSGLLFVRSGTSYDEAGIQATGLPLIIPTVTPPAEGETKAAVNGNMYFDGEKNISLASAGSTDYIKEDTYLYFAVESANVQNSTVSTGSADFYYSYTLYEQTDAGIVTGYSTSGNSGGEAVTVTVYGYNTVKGTSESAGNTFAAIQMNSGDLYARGGEYVSYFGNGSTYCVYASGGYMSVSSGTVFEAHERGICVNIAYEESHAEDEYLGVRGGDFYSAAGDTIRVSGGEMYVRGGTFTKNASAYSADVLGANGSAIAISGGLLDIEGTADERIVFSMEGSYMNGILSSADENGAAGTVTVTNTSFTFEDGTNNYGINSEAGTVTANGCVFTLPGENSRGISVERGTVTVGGAGGEAIENALDTNTYSYFYLDSAAGCYGVHADNASVSGGTSSSATVNMNAAQIFVGQSNAEAGEPSYAVLNGAGIYMNASGDSSSVTLGNVLVIAAGNSVSGVYVESGSITQNAGGKLVVVTGAQASGYNAGATQFRDIGSYGTDASGKITDLLGVGRVKRSETAYGYGVYSGGGKIDLQNVFAAVYGQYSAGILAASTDTSDAVTIGGALDIVVSQGNGADRVFNDLGSTLSSTAISTEGGPVTIGGNANIVSDGLGITARKGNVIFGSAAASSLQVNTARGTAVYVEGGTLTLNSGVTVDITSAIDDGWNWVDPPGTTAATEINKYNGVYVNGGSLIANGIFNVTHTGVATDNHEVEHESGSAWDEFIGRPYNPDGRSEGDSLVTSFQLKSFAVRVDSGSSAATEVTILKGEITNSVGGGVYVSGGIVTLGNSSSSTSDIVVTTTGRGLHNNTSNTVRSNYIPTTREGNWDYKLPSTGGHAVQVNGGTLTIYNGNYTAAQGDGIRVSNGTVNIYGGDFAGNDYGYTDRAPGDRLAGPAASYGFKLQGGTVYIYGGTFGSATETNFLSGSGAFIMGTGATGTDRGTANIYGGTFSVSGQGGISVYQYGYVTFAPGGGGAGHTGGNITVSGAAGGLIIEDTGGIESSVVIEAGVNGHTATFTATNTSGDGSGIWYGSSSAELTIRGGTFEGKSHSGLWLNNAPSSGNVQISGGVFNGTNDNGIDGSSTQYSAILAQNSNAYGRNNIGSAWSQIPFSTYVSRAYYRYITIGQSYPTT